MKARWSTPVTVSHPARLADAEYRPFQMATAARCGFTVPASLLTNRPGDARDFSRSGDGVVYKATMHKLISEADRIKLIYTTEATGAPIADAIADTLLGAPTT